MSSESILREVRELPAAIRATLAETRPSAASSFCHSGTFATTRLRYRKWHIFLLCSGR